MNVPALLIVENLIDRSARSDRSVATAAFALLAVASLLPTLLTPIPAMGDYVNHVVRMQLLSQMGTPNANPYYEAAWAFYPNLAMDLVVPSMARLIGAENATRLFLLFTQMLIVGGALALEWAVKRRVHLAGFAALLFLYCLPFTWGFVNFESALAIALWGIAAYLLAAERPASVRCAVNTVFVVVLFTAHFFALGIYGATLGLYELWRAFDRKVPYNDVALRLATLALPAAALLVVMRLTAGSVGSEGTFWNFDHKLPWLFFIMNGYNMAVSGASAIVLMTALYLAISCGMLKLQPRDLDRKWLRTPLSCDSAKAIWHGVRRHSYSSRGSFDPARVLLAVTAEPTREDDCARHCRRHHAGQSGHRAGGLAVLPFGIFGHDRVVSKDQSWFEGTDWDYRRDRGSTIRGPYPVSNVLCADACGALRECLRAARIHRDRQAADSDTCRGPPSLDSQWRARADTRTERNRHRPEDGA
ncbi:hypothetical protein [Bradyrhizobium sp. SUTN9-2]|uniref:hypothetical protein n=1 Tax=Bradyrhizobium sp. SUTN9-2 TaxID=1167456 RepID=UPI001FCE8C50|nr:hypothetical protein [Bradyrhizobium sp. SUTN9-2]